METPMVDLEMTPKVIEHLNICESMVESRLKKILTFYENVKKYVNTLDSNVSLRHNRISGINLNRTYPTLEMESILRMVEFFVGEGSHSMIFNPEYFFVNPDYDVVPYENILYEDKKVAYEFNLILWKRYTNNREAYESVLDFPDAFNRFISNDKCYILSPLAIKYTGAFDDIKSKIVAGYSKVQIPLSMYKSSPIREIKIMERILIENFGIEFIY